MTESDVVEMHEVHSPCIGACCLDANQICQGCFRSYHEIVRWWEAGDDERRVVLGNAERRKVDYQVTEDCLDGL